MVVQGTLSQLVQMVVQGTLDQLKTLAQSGWTTGRAHQVMATRLDRTTQ
jgi:hypothetical protein